MSNFFSVLSVFHHFFTCIALGDVDLHFSLMLVRTPILLKGKFNQSIHVADGVTVMSLLASLQYKTNAAVDFLCHITSNQKLTHDANAISC